MMHCQIPLYVGVPGAILERCRAGATGGAESEDLRWKRRVYLGQLQMCYFLEATTADDQARGRQQKQAWSLHHVH